MAEICGGQGFLKDGDLMFTSNVCRDERLSCVHFADAEAKVSAGSDRPQPVIRLMAG